MTYLEALLPISEQKPPANFHYFSDAIIPCALKAIKLYSVMLLCYCPFAYQVTIGLGILISVITYKIASRYFQKESTSNNTADSISSNLTATPVLHASPNLTNVSPSLNQNSNHFQSSSASESTQASFTTPNLTTPSAILFSPNLSDIPSPLSLKSDIELWDDLSDKTSKELRKINYLSYLMAIHRYENILCPSHSAIKINQYHIHANYVGKNCCSRVFVASQAPMEEDYSLFWQFIFDNNFSIIDLTSTSDQEERLSSHYFPTDVSQIYGNIMVSRKNKNNFLNEYTLTKMPSRESKTILRINYDLWPDGGIIFLDNLIALIELINSSCKGGLLVHCMAGRGRTGTIITALILKEKIERKIITKANFEESLIDIIAACRKERGRSFVQTIEQFSLIRQYGYHLLNSL